MPGSDMVRGRRARLLVATLAWLLGVVGATAVGLMAVGAIGDGIIGSGQRPLSPPEVQARLLAAATATRPAAAPGDVVQPLAAAAPEALASRGGTVLAQCRGEVIEVVSMTPAQGFRVEDQDEDGDKVTFESDEIKVKMRLSCADGLPTARETIDD